MSSPILRALVDAMSRRGLPDLDVALYGCDAHRDVLVAFAYCDCRARWCPYCGQWQRARGGGRKRAAVMRRLSATGGPWLLLTLNSAPVPESAAHIRRRAKALLAAMRDLMASPFGRAYLRGARAEVDFADAAPGIHLHLHVVAVGDFDHREHLGNLREAWEAALTRAAGAHAIDRGSTPVHAASLCTMSDVSRALDYAVKGFLFDPESPGYRYHGTLAGDVELSLNGEVVAGRGVEQWRALMAGLKGAHLTRSFGVLRDGAGPATAGSRRHDDAADLCSAPEGEPKDEPLVVEWTEVGDDEPEPSTAAPWQERSVEDNVSLLDCPRCRRALTWRRNTSGKRFLERRDAAEYRVECVPLHAARKITARTSPRVALMIASPLPRGAP